MAAGHRSVLILASAWRSRWRCSYTAFVVLFVLSGLGNGSTYKMIPGIFQGPGPRAVTGGGGSCPRTAPAGRVDGG